MKKRRQWMALALAGLMSLAGCGDLAAQVTDTPAASATPTPTALPAEELEFALPCYPGGGFHPITGTNRLNLTLAPLLYRGLFALDRNFVPQKDLCVDYEVSEDGLTWTLTLKEDTFSNGAALTAAEVVSSLNAARQSDRYGGRLEDVIRVRAQGEDKVEVTLSRPFWTCLSSGRAKILSGLWEQGPIIWTRGRRDFSSPPGRGRRCPGRGWSCGQ